VGVGVGAFVGPSQPRQLNLHGPTNILPKPPTLKRTCFNIRWSVRPYQKTRRPFLAPRGLIGRTSRPGPSRVIGRRSRSYPRRFKRS
jgi:hypothetical protein